MIRSLTKLVLVPGKIVYTIFVDCSIINADGNLFDATSYAVVSALISSKIPIFKIQDGKVIDSGDDKNPHLPQYLYQLQQSGLVTR